MSIYHLLGKNKITAVISDFYQRAFRDPIIGHFFFGKEHAPLLQGQLAFSLALLGGKDNYRGRDIGNLHQGMQIRNAHFNRRQQVLKEVLADHHVDRTVADSWLQIEERLRATIVTTRH